jgi:hypothetical protein
MSSRPWLDAIDDPAVEAQLTARPVPTGPKKPVAPQKRVHLWVAPINGERLPARHEFQRAGCVQMTSDGATFLWHGNFPATRAMLAVGTTSDATYLQASVVQVLPENGLSRVSCEYEKRY